MGQKKKNEKKNRIKNRRRSESENSDAFSECDSKVRIFEKFIKKII